MVIRDFKLNVFLKETMRQYAEITRAWSQIYSLSCLAFRRGLQKKKVIIILNVSVSIAPGYLKASPGSTLHFI